MIPVLIEAAFRSVLVGVVVALGLRVFRIHNVVAQKAAWGLVLIAALAMPWLLPAVARWQILPAGASIALPAYPMTLLEELQARILAKNPSGRMPQPKAQAVPEGESTQDESPKPSYQILLALQLKRNFSPPRRADNSPLRQQGQWFILPAAEKTARVTQRRDGRRPLFRLSAGLSILRWRHYSFCG